tara:strand:+ start:4981 stop:5145 length:165 start_codon:yes stop_codon:yes gene_type:complete
MSKEEKQQIDIIQSPKKIRTVNKDKIKKYNSIGLTDVSHIQYIKLRELWVKLQK